MVTKVMRIRVFLLMLPLFISSCAPAPSSSSTQGIPVSGNTQLSRTAMPGMMQTTSMPGIMQGTGMSSMMPGTGMPMMGEHPAAPAMYAGKTNPLAVNNQAAAVGKTIYDQDCASCHGATGNGDGPAAVALNPKPASLAEMKDDPDDYFFWRISEGGAMPPFNSAMPAWKNQLSQEQIWQVITYVRSLQN